MNKPIMTPEAKRLREFFDHLDLPNKVIASDLGKSEPMITKYLTGIVKIPISVVKALNSKYGMSFNWFFTGKGTKVINSPEKRTLINDVSYLVQSIASMEAQIEGLNRKIDKISRDFYDHKAGTQKGHIFNK